jgi:hypothetical protein
MVSAGRVPLSLASTKLRQHLGLSRPLRPLFRSSSSVQCSTLAVRRGRASAPRLFSGRSREAIALSARQHGPDDPGRPVCHRNGYEPGWFAFEQDAVLENLVPALDLAVRLGMERSTARVAYFLRLDPSRQFAGDVAGALSLSSRSLCWTWARL